MKDDELGELIEGISRAKIALDCAEADLEDAIEAAREGGVDENMIRFLTT